MNKFKIPCHFVALTIAMAISANAQDTSDIQRRLEAQYPLTRTTYDKATIVTAGVVLTLQKDNLKMVPTNYLDVFQNTYQLGRIKQNAVGNLDKAKKVKDYLCGRFGLPPCPPTPPAVPDLPTRTLMTGEKVWVTRINVNGHAVVFELLTDPDSNNVRYKASLTFLPTSSAEQVVAEVFSAQMTDGGPPPPQPVSSSNPYGPIVPPPPAEAGSNNDVVIPPPPPPVSNSDGAIVPPPPPLPQSGPGSRRISVGQTQGEVVAMLGQPTTIVAPSPNKELYIYPNLKITFVDHKVVDAQ